MYTKIYLFFKNLNNGKPYELPQKLVGNSFQFGQGFPLNHFFFFFLWRVSTYSVQS